jgi:anti-sigma regulatory factor (Ser/Thr protein kinase)
MEVVVQPAQTLYPIRDSGDVGAVRRAAGLLAQDLRFDDTARGRAALVATEVATNLVKHASGGKILLGTVAAGNETALEILALDSGPGMPDVQRSMADGYSTSGTPGTGLGAIRRVSTFFDLHTDPAGTALLARIAPGAGKPFAARSQIGAVVVPVDGEAVSGDAWAYMTNRERALFMIVDGLGHGRQAHEAAQVAIGIFKDHYREPGPDVLQLAHRASRGTRGAAAAIVELNLERRMISYTGIGNTSGVLVGSEGLTRSMVSSHGVLGGEERKSHTFEYPWIGDSLLILHSDGLTSRWELTKYPGLLKRDPSLIAGILYRDHSRGRDDVSVVVYSLGNR